MRFQAIRWVLAWCSLAASAGARAPAVQQAEPAERSPAPRPVLDEGYVGSAACAECHGPNHRSWTASFHRTMTQSPSAVSVLAPFEGTTPALEGVAWELERSSHPGGESFFVTPRTPDGSARGERGRVELLTGSHHYQIYWFSLLGSDELQQLPLVWHVAEARWVPRKAMFLQPPGPTGAETGRWRETCIKCHATNGTPHAVAASAEPGGETRVAELGIACEACHGPGAAHVELERGPGGASGASERLVVHPAELEHRRSSEVCGQCHGIQPLVTPEARQIWEREGFAYRPGAELAATRTLLGGTGATNSAALRAFLERNPATLAELFWPDGEVRVSGREYNGLVESPCFQRGTLACVSCHEMHPATGRPLARWAADQLKPGMEGPAACLQCHAEFSAPGKLAAHTHHSELSSGSDCLNCHMPTTTYGLTKAIRSHTITSPRAASALASARPSACNLCHLDRSLGWTADRLHEWYGHERPALDADQDTVAASVLWALCGDAGLRALAAASFAWAPARAVSGTGWMAPLLSTLLMDEYDAVRWVAVGSTRLEPRYAGFALDFCQELEEQRNHVRETVLSDWLRDGLQATPEQRAAVLVGPDGKLDDARFRRLYEQRDHRAVRLSE